MDKDGELKAIKQTDNTIRECDGEQPPQDAKPLEIDGSGLPVGISYGGA